MLATLAASGHVASYVYPTLSYCTDVAKVAASSANRHHLLLSNQITPCAVTGKNALGGRPEKLFQLGPDPLTNDLETEKRSGCCEDEEYFLHLSVIDPPHCTLLQPAV